MDNKPKNEYTGYYPKAGDELKFYLKHIIKLIKHGKPYENDKQFDGGTKPINRSKTRHGYDPGEDRKVYEANDPRGPKYEAGVEKARHDLKMRALRQSDPARKKMRQGKDWHSPPAKIKVGSYDPEVIKRNTRALLNDPKKQKEISSGKVQEGEEMIEEGYIKPYVSHSGSTATVMDSKGRIAASFSKKEHGPNYLDHANSHLKKNYDAYNTKDHKLSDLMNSPTVKHARTRHPGIQEETTRSLTDILGESMHDILDEERKVSSGATKAFLEKGKFKSKNTHVHDDDGVHVMKLHGNLIARHHPDGKVEVSHAGWGTKTTKERTNAIARAVGASGFSTRKHQLHHGDKPIDDDQWVTLRDNK
jgi:hypothetical protein